MSLNSGTLWIVATPLGNPGDLSPRAREVLESADCVLAEDTRRSGLLFSACGIKKKRLGSLHDHNEEGRLPAVLTSLRQGENIALVSDAGTPLLSDPGYRLVRACRKEGIKVIPVPGPSAALAALCASGLPPQPFIFLGFPPRKAGDREAFFAPYAALPVTMIFFERKDRVKESLASALKVLGAREGCIARELTKTYEEFILFDLSDYAVLSDDLLGEITIILGPPVAVERFSDEEVLKIIAFESEKGGKSKEIAKRVAEQSSGWTVKEIYALMQG